MCVAVTLAFSSVFVIASNSSGACFSSSVLMSAGVCGALCVVGDEGVDTTGLLKLSRL